MKISPDQLIAAYANGYFPMAMERDDPELFWFSPEERGVIPLDAFNIPRGLRRSMKSMTYTITTDQDFAGVIRGCAEVTPARGGTWINDAIIELYTELFRLGDAHSVEVWAQEEYRVQSTEFRKKEMNAEQNPTELRQLDSGLSLVGGLYGVSIGGAFFGESMFSRAADASKVALVALVEILREAGYSLLDTQYVNDHLKQFGVIAVPKADYMIKLEKALKASPSPTSRFSTASVRKGFASVSSAS